LVAGLGLANALPARESPTPPSGAAILQDLRSFNIVASVLHIAAHPDDENTALITYFARGRGYRMAYLSLTRGEGGQNEIGPEFDEKLGVARTQELLAARRLDGGRQFFTRAIDFGFSKTPEETLRFWDRTQVLGDVVRIIRTFRPDVVITRFPNTGGGTHGHHTASGILGVEAFKLAGDPKAYPEQIAQGLTIWQPKRVVLNSGGFGGGGRGGRGGGGGGRGGASESSTGVKMDIGGKDPVTGEDFGAIAARSRAQHITQGFGNFGGRGGGGPNEQTFIPQGGEPAKSDLMDGIDTTWSRFAGGDTIANLAGQAILGFKVDDPAASISALLAIRKALANLPSDPVIDDKRAQLDRILQACLGLTVQTTADQAEIIPGEQLKLQLAAQLRASVPVKWIETRTEVARAGVRTGFELPPQQARFGALSFTVPPETPLTQPYWLREESTAGIAHVSNPNLIGSPENFPVFPVEYVFELEGQKLIVADEPKAVVKDAKGEHRRRVDVIPVVSLRFASDVSLFTPGATKPVIVEAVTARAGVRGSIALELPAGWQVLPAKESFALTSVGEKVSVTFKVTAPSRAAAGQISAFAEVGGKRSSHKRVEVNYSHIPLQLLQPPARARLVSVEVVAKGKKVGYLPGAGDDTAAALTQLDYEVSTLSGADLTLEKLRSLDAVVIGVRAFNERKDLAANLPGLFAYMENGGTVIAQYNRPTGLRTDQLGPFALSIEGAPPDLRITDEQAPVSFLDAEHPALNTPNKITSADFAGWVQERGAYFPSSWDKSYVPLLAMNDPGEGPLKSAVLIARYGRGYYVYTGLAFFRQLPAGVPGAYRLFANLVSLGK
jgi:LmbE family N-acetylglucosaminyl deacetylase